METEVTRSINYWAVLVAAASYFILGAAWYSGALFGKVWTTAIGKTPEQVKADYSPLNLLWVFILAWLAAYGIARVYIWSGGDSVGDGLWVGLLAGVCFAMATLGIHDIMEKRPRSLTGINVLYSILGFLLMGLIIGIWH